MTKGEMIKFYKNPFFIEVDGKIQAINIHSRKEAIEKVSEIQTYNKGKVVQAFERKLVCVTSNTGEECA